MKKVLILLTIVLLSCGSKQEEKHPACIGDDNEKAREFMKTCYEETRYLLVGCISQTLKVYGCLPDKRYGRVEE